MKMKGHKISRIGLILLLLLMVASGCSLSRGDATEASTSDAGGPKGIFNQKDEDTTTEASSEPTEDTSDKNADTTTGLTDEEAAKIYSGVLDDFCHIILVGEDGLDNMELEEGAGWIYDVMMGRDSADVLASVGYRVQDISGDGIPELLVGAITDQDDYNDYGSYIYSVYTIVDGEPHCTIEGWYRSSYRMMNNGQIYYEGSGGAMYSIFAVYDISKDGTELICQDYYFTSNTDDSYEEYAMYHNTTGDWDISVSEMLDLPEDEFWNVGEEFRQQTYNLSYTSLSDYIAQNGQITYDRTGRTPMSDSSVAIHMYRFYEIQDQYDDFDEYAVGSQYEDDITIAFTTDRVITDVKVLALEFQDVTQDGTMIFDETVRYQQDELTPERPLIVGITMMGTIPNNGISYVDSNGDYRRYAITESGEDGSLLLMEY